MDWANASKKVSDQVHLPSFSLEAELRILERRVATGAARDMLFATDFKIQCIVDNWNGRSIPGAAKSSLRVSHRVHQGNPYYLKEDSSETATSLSRESSTKRE